MDLRLSGKRALVTGSSVGIGETIARTLAVEGVAVAVHGRERERAEHVAGPLRAASPSHVHVPVLQPADVIPHLGPRGQRRASSDGPQLPRRCREAINPRPGARQRQSAGQRDSTRGAAPRQRS